MKANQCEYIHHTYIHIYQYSAPFIDRYMYMYIDDIDAHSANISIKIYDSLRLNTNAQFSKQSALQLRIYKADGMG